MVKILYSLLHTICSSWDTYIILNVDTPIREFAFPSHTSVLLYAREISHARMTFSGYRQSALCWASAIHRCKCLKSSEVNIVISSSETSPVTTFVLKKKKKSYCVINSLCVILTGLPHNPPIRTELTLSWPLRMNLKVPVVCIASLMPSSR